MAGKADKVLHGGSGSIPCWKPMIALAEKNLKYDGIMISLSKKNHKTNQELKQFNPLQQVSTFRDGEIVVNESNGICDYLERRYNDQGTSLIPKDHVQAANALQRMHETCNLKKYIMENIMYYHYMTKPEDIDKELLAKRKLEAHGELNKWDGYMTAENGFIVGSCFSMVDVCLFPLIDYCVRLQVDMTQFPDMDAYYKRLMERPPFPLRSLRSNSLNMNANCSSVPTSYWSRQAPLWAGNPQIFALAT